MKHLAAAVVMLAEAQGEGITCASCHLTQEGKIRGPHPVTAAPHETVATSGDAWAVRPVGEVFVERERDLPTTVSGLVGTIWRASDALSFDAAVRLARAGGVSTTELRVGLTWGFSVGIPR
jgi:hypothetical protein